MTVTSAASGPDSLSIIFNMLTPKRYHLQQGLTSNSTPPASNKQNCDTLSRGKKSWSVRLGLSRHSQPLEDPIKSWGTISAGSALSRQMTSGNPWIYGTVRAPQSGHNPQFLLNSPPPPGTPILIVCSCPEFLSGTTRKLGNCWKCGGHRLAGLPFGGTCRLPSTPARTRPSLSGILRSPVNDPYDQMRRNRLIEPNSRTSSISPFRQDSQKDVRSQTVIHDISKFSQRTPSSQEWFNIELNSERSDHQGSKFSENIDDWPDSANLKGSGKSSFIPEKAWALQKDWQIVAPHQTFEINYYNSVNSDWADTSTLNHNDSRKSILECNVNPYLLVKEQAKDGDELSDDLSDNALEQNEISSNLFDPSKVKSIEKIPNRSAVAAISGQRVRVFNELKEVHEDKDLSISKIPIPKISPKRPPRRLKEAKTVLKSILKRGGCGGKRKNVLFNLNDVIFAPEKPPDVGSLILSSKNSVESKETRHFEGLFIHESQVLEKPKFITVPKIREPVREKSKFQEVMILPKAKEVPLIEKIKIDKFVPSEKLQALNNTEKPHRNIDIELEETNDATLYGMKQGEKDQESREGMEMEREKPEDKLKLEDRKASRVKLGGIEHHSTNDTLEEENLMSSSAENSRQSSLSQSQIENSTPKAEYPIRNINLVVQIEEDGHESPGNPISVEPVEEFTILSQEKSPAVTTLFYSKETNTEDEPILRIQKSHTEPDTTIYSNLMRNSEHFRRMRATNWSPPPGKFKHQVRNRTVDQSGFKNHLKISSESEKNHRNDTYLIASNCVTWKKTLVDDDSWEKNVCKITVNPKFEEPLVHRLQVDSKTTPRGTSILIDGRQEPNANESENKVTISVGGEDSVYNPTVISVNSDSKKSLDVQSSTEKKTLVILRDYSSNIIIGSESKEVASEASAGDLKNNHELEVSENKKFSGQNNQTSKSALKTQLQAIEDSKLTEVSRETLISKLLEDSLRKARENGEVLDESSGEKILKILKQSLLKSKDNENLELRSEIEMTYSTPSNLSSKMDFISTNLFMEENPYEVIKEPIYEEIPDEPPPLPTSPPPTEDFFKNRLYFGDEYEESYQKKKNSDQLLETYLSDDSFKKTTVGELMNESYLLKSPEEFFKKTSTNPDGGNLSTKFELLDFMMNSKNYVTPMQENEDEDDDVEEEEDTERDLDVLYEQKETSLGDLSSKSSQISNVSDSSEECNIILTSSSDNSKTRNVEIERTDSGVGSESSQASSSRGIGCRRWRNGNTSSGSESLINCISQNTPNDTKLCEDCEQRLEPLITDSGVVYTPFVCRKCSKKRAERKEIITEIVETEQKYGRDLQIILEEFYQPMLKAGLLTSEQLSAIFLNVEELLEHNIVLAEKLKEAVEFAQEVGDEDIIMVDVGKIFLESERMLHAFENYCVRQGGASLLLQNLEKEKELLRIFLKVSQMENTVLRRMNLNSFLMVPVQRVTKYPLLLARLLKATPSSRPDLQEARKRLEEAQANIELHLEHMNAEAKDVTSTKLWRRISMTQNGRRCTGETDMVNIKLRKMAVEILEWAHEESRFILEGRLLIAQPTDNNWRRGRTIKLTPVTAMLVINGKSNTDFLDFTSDSLFRKQTGIKEATLLIVKEKLGRYTLHREPLYLDKCIVCCETELDDYFEIQELSSKETFIVKAENDARTKIWCKTLQVHAQSLGIWRRRRGALPNIMICGVARN